MPLRELRGKIAVVTGGASGIGRAMGERFAREGMALVLADVERPALEATVAEPAEFAAVTRTRSRVPTSPVETV